MMIEWSGCYKQGWQDVIVPAAFSHPAKVSFGLSKRIYEYMLEQDWLHPGDWVLDPFLGIGGFAFHALLNGVNFVGVELEPKFHALALENLAKWRKDYGAMLKGEAVLLQGDSRNLAQVVREAGALMSSPPFSDSLESKDEAFQKLARPGRTNQNSDYGSTPGQLGAMRAGDVDSVISKNVSDALSAVYLVFFDAKENIATLMEIGVSLNVLSNLLAEGMPVFSIGLQDGVGIRKIEVGEIRPDIELPDVINSGTIKEKSKSIFKLALFGLPITTDGAIDAATIIQAVRLYGEFTSTGRTLSFDLSSPEFTKALIGAEFTDTSGRLGWSIEKLFATLQTFNLNTCLVGNIGTPCRTIACASFGVYGRNIDEVSANFADNSNSSPASINNCALLGTAFNSILNFAGLSMECFTANRTSGIGKDIFKVSARFPFATLENKITLLGTERIGGTLHVFGSTGEIGGTDRADKISGSHFVITPSRLPTIITQNNAGNMDAAVSSPPYDKTDLHSGGWNKEIAVNSCDPRFIPYGTTPGQLGEADDFWHAARTIVQQCYLVLKPGAYTAWVLKGYIKNKQLVDFPSQWRQLCEACGFEFVQEVHASLVKETHIGNDLFSGEVVTKRTERKSFFRRLAEKNGSPPINWETVLFLRKPDGEGEGVDGCVSSPPFTDTVLHDGGKADYLEAKRLFSDYGSTTGQLGSMPAGSIADALEDK
jgi:hypothetical protein